VGALGAAALLLAAVGLCGTLAYTVALRTREIGVRLALGASGRSVVALFVRRSLRLGAIGVTIGALGALGASRVLSARLGVPSLNITPLLSSGLVLALATIAASYLPSRRVARVDPALSLRGD